MFGLDKNTIGNLVVLISSVLIFNGMINLPAIGLYLKEYPLIILIIAVVLLAFKEKIANSIGG